MAFYFQQAYFPPRMAMYLPTPMQDRRTSGQKGDIFYERKKKCR